MYELPYEFLNNMRLMTFMISEDEEILRKSQNLVEPIAQSPFQK